VVKFSDLVEVVLDVKQAEISSGTVFRNFAMISSSTELDEGKKKDQ